MQLFMGSFLSVSSLVTDTFIEGAFNTSTYQNLPSIVNAWDFEEVSSSKSKAPESKR